MNRSLWTVSNSLSFLRIVLVVPLAAYLSSGDPGSRLYAIGLITVIVVTDFLDGFFARKLGQTTNLGKIIDPVADKVAVAVITIVLARRGVVPVWFVFAAVTRDALILLGGLYLRKKKGILLQSDALGKWTVGVISLYIFFVVLEIRSQIWLINTLLFLCVAMLIVSFINYVLRFVRISKSLDDRFGSQV